MTGIFQRIRAATGILLRGSIAPFDRIPVIGGGEEAQKLKMPYAQSVWVHAAIRHIARPVSAAALVLSASPRRRGVAAVPISDPRLDALWSAPARCLTSLPELLLASVGWRKLAGETFWILGDESLVPFPEVRERLPRIIVARPDDMRHVVEDGELVGWEYRDGQGRRHALLPAQVIHLRQWNPYDEFRGLGDYEAVAIAAAGDVDSARFSRNLASANGDQGVYVVGKSGVIEDNQRKQITATLREKADLQRRGIFRPVFLTGDIEVQDPKIRSVDTSFLDSRRMSAAEGFVAFGVPPSMAKESASYSIGGASDYFRLILDACMPEAQEIAAGIARVSSVLTGRNLHAWFSWDDHPVMQEVRKERTDAAMKLWGMGVPTKVISSHLDLGLPRFEGDDVPWVPMGVVPAGQAALGIDPAAYQEMPAGSEAASTPAEPEAEQEPVGEPKDAVELALAALRSRIGRGTSAEARLWQRHMRLRKASVRAFESAFTRVLHQHRAAALRKLAGLAAISGKGEAAQEAPESPAADKSAVTTPSRASGGSYPAAVARREALFCASSGEIIARAGVIDFILGIGEWVRDLWTAFRSPYLKTMDTATEQLSEELGRDPEDPMTMPPSAAMQFLAARENRISGVAQETFDGIRAQIQAGLDAGETTAQLADRVRAAFNGASKERAMRIAITETAAAYGHARQKGMEQAGVRYKRWLTSGGDNVRPTHREANNQAVPVSEPYRVGGENLMHPGDPAGSAANVINCYCVSVAVPPEDEPEALADPQT
jgi:hypothetical protein